MTNFEPPHDKPNKMACASSKDSDQPVHLPSLISLRCPHEESLGSYMVVEHVTNDVCFIPIMGTAILKILPAQRRFSRF